MRGVNRLRRVWATARNRPDSTYGRFPPGHYYSPVPDWEEVALDSDRIFEDVSSIPGITLDPHHQLSVLSELSVGGFPDPGPRFHQPNGWFQGCDAAVLFGMIQTFRPNRVIEVGSGFSSALMLDAESDTELVFIDPNPQDRLEGLLREGDRRRATVLARRVQDIPAEWFVDQLEGGDVLFIDSSHVVKVGSDVNHLLLDVVPRLASGVRVHIHDVGFPFEYPRAWVEDRTAWNEAYLVRGLLAHSPRYRIDVWNSYLWQREFDAARAALPHWGRSPGSSLWFSVQ